MLSLYIIPAYLAIVSGVYKYAPKINPKRTIQAYNILQVVCNIPIFTALAYFLTTQATGPFLTNVPKSSEIATFTMAHYVTKYLDLFDTLFIALRKSTRQLTFLHVYHHVSILMVWEYIVECNVHNGTGATPAMINSFVHAVMYFHYLLQSFDIKHKYKHWITRIQIAQFVYGFFHSIAMLHHENVIQKKYAIIQLVYQIQMLYLFGNFYIKTYTTKLKNI
jgi:elongation of very long chain fatty acids protein 4